MIARVEFKTILAEFLNENNLTQSDFANIIGVDHQLVGDWLKGRAKPGYDSLYAMAKAFDVTADYFLGLKDEY